MAAADHRQVIAQFDRRWPRAILGSVRFSRHDVPEQFWMDDRRSFRPDIFLSAARRLAGSGYRYDDHLDGPTEEIPPEAGFRRLAIRSAIG
jgi:hypothetical protein